MSLDIAFLGTGSGYPSPSRGASAIAIRYEGVTWMVDCGEGTQTQIMNLKSIRPGSITKFFITHLHGDHLFGLPGLLCTLSMAYTPQDNESINKEEQVIEIYGPHGIRRYVRDSLSLSRSLLTFKYVVHELMPIDIQFEPLREDDPDWKAWTPDHSCKEEEMHPNEVEGRNIEFDSTTASWSLVTEGSIKVVAGVLRHRVPTFGYVFTEESRPGRLLFEKLMEFGVPKGRLFGKIKNGETVTLEDGRIVDPKNFVAPPTPGRKIAILQDTCNSDAMMHLCQHCTVMVHEATNEEVHREKCEQNGHSTAIMAAEFASKTCSKHLILTHFSQRYKHCSTNEEDPTTDILVKEASSVISAHQVTAAYDGLIFPVKTSAT